MLDKMVHWIYGRFSDRGIVGSGEVEESLSKLYPGQKTEQLRQQFYEEKIKLVLLVCLAGIVFGAMAKVFAGKQGVLLDGNKILRGDYDSGTKKVKLICERNGEKVPFQIELMPRQLTTQEVLSLVAAFRGEIEHLILGENKDLQRVTQPLMLVDYYEAYPFEVSWRSEEPNLLDDSGKLGLLLEEEQVRLTYTLRYGEYENRGELSVTLCPPDRTELEQAIVELTLYLRQQEANKRKQEAFLLPNEWGEQKLSWSEEKKDYSTLLWAATPLLALGLFFMKDQDLRKELEERASQLKQAYPELVHKLVLYIGAGMSVRGALNKIAGDYEKKRDAGGATEYWGEELLLLSRQLHAGTLEEVAIDHFGRRAGVREYIRLSTLLVQNRRRGNRELVSRLLEEADKSLEEQLLAVRKSGEEAGTKLLIPMVCLLGIVMVIIMVPAFGTL